MYHQPNFTIRTRLDEKLPFGVSVRDGAFPLHLHLDLSLSEGDILGRARPLGHLALLDLHVALWARAYPEVDRLAAQDLVGYFMLLRYSNSLNYVFSTPKLSGTLVLSLSEIGSCQ